MKLDLYLSPTIKINSRWIKNLTVRPETIKLLKENMGDKLLDIGLGKEVLRTDTKSLNYKIKN